MKHFNAGLPVPRMEADMSSWKMYGAIDPHPKKHTQKQQQNVEELQT